MHAQMATFNQTMIETVQEIHKLKEANMSYHKANIDLTEEVRKIHLVNDTLKTQVEGLEQYTRMNSIEIGGIAKVESRDGDKSEEEVIIDCLNSLIPQDDQGPKFESSDIDISHILPKRSIFGN